MFVNILTADDTCSLHIMHNLFQHLQMQLSQKKSHFLNFFLHFRNLHLILKKVEKNMTLIADVFLN